MGPNQRNVEVVLSGAPQLRRQPNWDASQLYTTDTHNWSQAVVSKISVGRVGEKGVGGTQEARRVRGRGCGRLQAVVKAHKALEAGDCTPPSIHRSTTASTT